MILNRQKPLVIFEMANNHMGDVSHGKKIIQEFAFLGVERAMSNFNAK